MSSAAHHHETAYFQRMYSNADDPWGFEDRWYERRKYALTLALLTRSRYRAAFEPGCANGALTALLQERCDRLFACELLPEVAARARDRLAGFDHVEVRDAAFPDWWPTADLDLLVLSEIAYYLTPAGRTRAEAAIAEHLVPGADVVAVHFTGDTNYPMRGTDVAEWLDGLPDLDAVVRLSDDRFEAGVWRRRTPASPDGLNQTADGRDRTRREP